MIYTQAVQCGFYHRTRSETPGMSYRCSWADGTMVIDKFWGQFRPCVATNVAALPYISQFTTFLKYYLPPISGRMYLGFSSQQILKEHQ